MGLTTSVSLFQAIIVGAVNLIFTVVAIVTIDRFGRRPLQIIGVLVRGSRQRTGGGRPGLMFFFSLARFATKRRRSTSRNQRPPMISPE